MATDTELLPRDTDAEATVDAPPAMPVETETPEAEAASGLRLLWPALFSKLRVKLIVPYALLTVLLAGVAIFITTRLVAASIEERFSNQLIEANRVSGDAVVRRERTHLDNLRLMAFTEGVPQAFAEGDPKRLQDLLLPVMLNYNVEAVTTIDLKGREIVSLARSPSSQQYIQSTGLDFSGYKIVQDVLQGRNDAIGDKFADVLPTGQGLYFFTSTPVRDAGGKLAGVLMIGSRLESLLAEIKTQSIADVILLDRKGQLMATTLTKPDEGFTLIELPESEAALINPSRVKDVRLYGRGYRVFYAPLIVRQQPIGVLGTVLSSNYIVDTTTTSRNLFGLIFTLGTLAVIVVGYVVARSIAIPLLQLRKVSKAVTEGDLEQQTGIQQPGEIGELASAFDEMTLRLRERTDEAARLYADAVKYTEELKQINAELHAAQQQLVQSEKLAAIGQLTAGIVHDVKNPLAVVIGMSEELRDDESLEPAIRNYLSTIRDSAWRANTIIGDLLKFARQSTPEMKRQNIVETIETALRLTDYLARKGSITVIKDLPPEPVVMTYDATQIEQVLINLIQNAIQATPSGGRLTVMLRRASETIAIAVQDTGTGISPENMRRIFDPFFTTKPPGEGTGLGLSVSYGIIARHGGHIKVDSEPGKGTTFTILLPSNLAPSANPAQPNPIGSTQESGLESRSHPGR
jgi:signal transduction histidine kinase